MRLSEVAPPAPSETVHVREPDKGVPSVSESSMENPKGPSASGAAPSTCLVSASDPVASRAGVSTSAPSLPRRADSASRPAPDAAALPTCSASSAVPPACTVPPACMVPPDCPAPSRNLAPMRRENGAVAVGLALFPTSSSSEGTDSLGVPAATLHRPSAPAKHAAALWSSSVNGRYVRWASTGTATPGSSPSAL